MNGRTSFWEKPLATLDRGEWEALCDGCGHCVDICPSDIMHIGKALPALYQDAEIDPRTGDAGPNLTQRLTAAFDELLAPVFSCLDNLDWLPETCAYRLRAAGKPLPKWHYLITGSRETVHEAGQSTRGWTVSEEDAGELEFHVVERPL